MIRFFIVLNQFLFEDFSNFKNRKQMMGCKVNKLINVKSRYNLFLTLTWEYTETESDNEPKSPFFETNNDTLNPWLSSPLILVWKKVSEYPGIAGNTKPMFISFGIKKLDHVKVLALLEDYKHHYIYINQYFE